MKYLSAWDFILTPLLILIVVISARRIENQYISQEPHYKYYFPGLMMKIFGGIMLGLIYVFYYGGGDTIQFWTDSVVLNNLMFYDFFCWTKLMLGDMNRLWFWCFDPYETGIPYYFPYDPQSYSVPRYLNVLSMFAGYSYFPLTVLTAWASYTGVWRLYLVFCEEYPKLIKEFAYATLFMPSVLFWGSGIMKDTITFSAACWFTYASYNIVLKRREILKMILFAFIAAYVMVSIRPYIFVALMPGVIIWVMFNRVKRIDNLVIKLLIAPVMLMIAIGMISVVLSSSSSALGDYGSVDQILNKAVATQQDLKREAYEGNTFDIGDFEPTIPGILSKLPVAIWAGMFRPTIFDVRNVVMFLSALENLFLLYFTMKIFFTTGFFGFFRGLTKEPTALFTFVFALFFAFSVGLTTSNFGSLVRYKIPSVPFMMASLFIIRHIVVSDREGEIKKREDELQALKEATSRGAKPGSTLLN